MPITPSKADAGFSESSPHLSRCLSLDLEVGLKDRRIRAAALEEALSKGRPQIFNTDQGSQFTSEAFTSEAFTSMLMKQMQSTQVLLQGSPG